MKKSTAIMVLVFAILLVVVLVRSGDDRERGVSRFSFGGLELTQSDRLEITDHGQTTVLVRTGEEWRIEGGRRAEASSVRNALEAVGKMASSKLLTRQPERFAELQVDADAGVEVAVSTQGQEVARFVIGSGGPGASSVRIGDEVFSVPGVYAGTFKRKGTGWVDRTIIELTPADINRLSVETGGDTFTLVASGTGWTLHEPSVLPAGFRFDKDAAADLVTAFTKLRVREFIEVTPDEKRTGLGEGATVIRVERKGSNEQALVLRVGTEQAGDTVYASLSTGDTFTISEHAAAKWTKGLGVVRDLGLLRFDPQRVQEVTIYDSGRALGLAREQAVWKIAESSVAVPAGFELDTMAVDAWLKMLTMLDADALRPELTAKRERLDQSARWLRLAGPEGILAELRVGRSEGAGEQTQWLVRGNADGGVYSLGQAMVERVLVTLPTLRKRTQMMPPGGVGSIDPEALSKLPPEIREQILNQLAQQEREQAFRESQRSPGP